MQQRRYAEACSKLSALRRENPTRDDLLLLYAFMLILSGDKDLSFVSATQLRRSYPKVPVLLDLLSVLSVLVGYVADAQRFIATTDDILWERRIPPSEPQKHIEIPGIQYSVQGREGQTISHVPIRSFYNIIELEAMLVGLTLSYNENKTSMSALSDTLIHMKQFVQCHYTLKHFILKMRLLLTNDEPSRSSTAAREGTLTDTSRDLLYLTRPKKTSQRASFSLAPYIVAKEEGFFPKRPMSSRPFLRSTRTTEQPQSPVSIETTTQNRYHIDPRLYLERPAALLGRPESPKLEISNEDQSILDDKNLVRIVDYYQSGLSPAKRKNNYLQKDTFLLQLDETLEHILRNRASRPPTNDNTKRISTTKSSLFMSRGNNLHKQSQRPTTASTRSSQPMPPSYPPGERTTRKPFIRVKERPVK